MKFTNGDWIIKIGGFYIKEIEVTPTMEEEPEINVKVTQIPRKAYAAGWLSANILAGRFGGEVVKKW